MEWIYHYPPVALVVLIYMIGWFLLATIKQNNGLVDIAWGLGFVVIATFTLLSSEEQNLVQWLMTSMITIWGIRLSTHIGLRNLGKPEDFRYKKWREEWGNWVIPRAFMQVFLLQGFLMLIIAAPIIVVNTTTQQIGWIHGLAILLWAVGFLFEAIGDHQKSIFKKNPTNKGKLLTTGLWKYTRHPNYFGEATLWWGIAFMGIMVPYGWIGLISPLTINFLLLKVSGIPMLERKYEGREDFEKYKKQTNAFFPWCPKK